MFWCPVRRKGKLINARFHRVFGVWPRQELPTALRNLCHSGLDRMDNLLRVHCLSGAGREQACPLQWASQELGPSENKEPPMPDEPVSPSVKRLFLARLQKGANPIG